MNRIYEIISLTDNEIDSYIEKRLDELNIADGYEEISLLEDGDDIHTNWINTDAVYLPSGNRSRGFKFDIQFLKDLVRNIRENFGKIPLDNLKANLNENKLIKWFNIYVISFFGSQYDEIKRKEIYGYGSLNSIGETLDISGLKGLNVARCIEKSSALNQILNFLDIDSSLVLSEANGIGHAYCLVKINDKYSIVDPNFYGTDVNGKGIPYIFEINPYSNLCSFDPALFGDNKSLKINYNFPSQRMPGIKR